MPDISMCRNHECPLKDACYRYTATPSDRQPYHPYEPNENGTCDTFMQDRRVEGVK